MIDDTDVKIINSLLANSRLALTELSKKIGISSVAIQQRINKLEKKGIIKGFTSQIDYKILGFSTTAFIGIFLEKAKFYKSVIDELNKVKEISEAHFTTGNYSIFAKVYARNNDHLMEILNTRVQNITGIARTETFISLEEGILKPLNL
jgi:Lrp/AsnC family transcriptional regulator for asnA, asnC and gidA